MEIINGISRLFGPLIITLMGTLIIIIGFGVLKTRSFHWSALNLYQNFWLKGSILKKYPELGSDKTINTNVTGKQAKIHGILFLIFGLLIFSFGIFTLVVVILSFFEVRI